jgi:hypothetical protein
VKPISSKALVNAGLIPNSSNVDFNLFFTSIFLYKCTEEMISSIMILDRSAAAFDVLSYKRRKYKGYGSTEEQIGVVDSWCSIQV